METLDINVLDDIGYYGVTLKDVMSEYSREKETKGKAKKVRVSVNSYGGEVLEGLAIYNFIKGREEDTETNIVGYAISAGSFIALASNKVKMSDKGYFMIHNPWGATYGGADDMEGMALLLRSMTDEIAKIYVNKTGKSIEDIKSMMDAETWLSAEEALSHGFVDELTSGSEVMNYAKVDLTKFKNVPEKVRNIVNKNSEKMDAKKFAEHKVDVLNEVSTKIDDIKNTVTTMVEDKLKEIDPEKLTNTVKDSITSMKDEILTELKASLKDVVADQTKDQIDELKTSVDSMDQKIKDAETRVADIVAKIPGAPDPDDPNTKTPAENAFVRGAVAKVSNKSKY